MRLLQFVVIQQEVLEDFGPSIVALLKKNREISSAERYLTRILKSYISKKSEVFLAPEDQLNPGDSALASGTQHWRNDKFLRFKPSNFNSVECQLLNPNLGDWE